MAVDVPDVSVIVVAYGGLDLVVRAADAALASQGVGIEVIVANNAIRRQQPPTHADSSDASGTGLSAAVRWLEVGFNAGYGGALNRGIAATRGRYVLCLNQDVALAPDYLARMTAFCDAHPTAGAASGKILRTPSMGEGPVIDSAGVFMKRHRGAFDRGEGAVDEGQFDAASEVFAASGAALFARRAALDDVAGRDGPFDEAMFMYKEDVDLGWRLRLRGWSCWYLPEAVAFHGRTSSSLAGRAYRGGAGAYWRVLRSRPPYVRRHSLQNQWRMVLKDDSALASFRGAPAILGRELALTAANALASPSVAIGAVAGFGRGLRATLAERRRVQERRTATGASMARWFR